jgi:hypothetical protein
VEKYLLAVFTARSAPVLPERTAHALVHPLDAEQDDVKGFIFVAPKLRGYSTAISAISTHALNLKGLPKLGKSMGRIFYAIRN